MRRDEGGLPTYVAGDEVRLAAGVRATGRGIRRVYAVFAHGTDPGKKIWLSDDPESRSHARVQTGDEVGLRGAVTGEHPAGEYRLEEMAAEYPGGRTVRFSGVPDAGFRVVDEEIPSPEVIGWRWM